MFTNSFLLYGANGYTGTLIARYAHEYNLRPILAGRNKTAIETMARELNLPYRVFDLNDTVALTSALKEVPVVIHAAGPFRYTAKQMIEACLNTGTHYLDINGDISVFEFLKEYNEKALQKKIMVMPGVGFDVVPTDCLALLLKKRLPDANTLRICFASKGGSISHGTAITMADKAGEGGAIRKEGKIIKVPLGNNGMWMNEGEKKIWVMRIPWGDVSTAHFTTGIPNIETYAGAPPYFYRLLKFQLLFNWLLRTKPVRNYIMHKINERPAGPNDEMRKNANVYVWAQATNEQGKTLALRLTGPEGYTITLHSSLLIVKKVLEGQYKPGYQTPAAVYGENLIKEVPGIVIN
jgi:short subunit dehydrogenase-like uncharacterized protein